VSEIVGVLDGVIDGNSEIDEYRERVLVVLAVIDTELDDNAVKDIEADAVKDTENVGDEECVGVCERDDDIELEGAGLVETGTQFG
jgi:hypothetical protein